MGITDFNTMAKQSGGTWVSLRKTGDRIVGELIDTEEREKTFEGAAVLSRKTGKPRREIVVTIKVDDRTDDEDDGVRKVSANESMQRALIAAAKKVPFVAGGRIAIEVTEDAPGDREQATYEAAFKAPARDLSPKPSADLADLLG